MMGLYPFKPCRPTERLGALGHLEGFTHTSGTGWFLGPGPAPHFAAEPNPGRKLIKGSCVPGVSPYGSESVWD